MTKLEGNSQTGPLFSVIIPVYNDWTLVARCLQSLADGPSEPNFEVIVVDDGSRMMAPEFIRHWSEPFPLTFVRQPKQGIAAARNLGIRNAHGSVLVFTDADCLVEKGCLGALASAIANLPQHDYFQLHITGGGSGLVGRADDLRLDALQNYLLRPDGCIRYLNTSGFAVRREMVNIERGLFDPSVCRAEDTLLLARLMLGGKLPVFVSGATVRHAIPLPVMAWLRKDMRSAYLEGKTFELIASMGVKMRMSHRERARMLISMWKSSGRRANGRLAWFMVLARTALARMVSGICAFFRLWPGPPRGQALVRNHMLD